MIKKLCRAYICFCSLLFLIAGAPCVSDKQKNWIAQLDGVLELPQVRAFLDVIAYAEGTFMPFRLQGKSIDNRAGYTMLYGGGTFSSYHDHPRKILAYRSNNRLLKSTAAGRYQILARTWDAWAPVLQLRTFHPRNQDRLALALIRESGALYDVIEGRYQKAFKKVAPIWASLPGASYGQRVLDPAVLTRFYKQRLAWHQKYQIKYCN